MLRFRESRGLLQDSGLCEDGSRVLPQHRSIRTPTDGSVCSSRVPGTRTQLLGWNWCFDTGVQRFSRQHPPNVVSHSVRHFRNRDALLSKKTATVSLHLCTSQINPPMQSRGVPGAYKHSNEQGWQVFSPCQPAGAFTACRGLAPPEPWPKWQEDLAGETRWHHTAPCTFAKEPPARDFCLQFGFW